MPIDGRGALRRPRRGLGGLRPGSRARADRRRRTGARAIPAAAGRDRIHARHIRSLPREIPACRPTAPAWKRPRRKQHAVLSHGRPQRSPPRVEIPRDYNAAARSDRAQPRGRARRQARLHRRPRQPTYGELAERVDRAANALRALGLEPEQRVLLCLLDTIDFPAAFLGAIKAGIVPIAANTLLTDARLRLHAARQPRARAGRLRALYCRVRAAARQAARICAHVIVVRRTRRAAGLARAARSPRRRRRAPRRRRRRATTPASGCTPRARPARPRAPCICTRT